MDSRNNDTRRSTACAQLSHEQHLYHEHCISSCRLNKLSVVSDRLMAHMEDSQRILVYEHRVDKKWGVYNLPYPWPFSQPFLFPFPLLPFLLPLIPSFSPPALLTQTNTFPSLPVLPQSLI